MDLELWIGKDDEAVTLMQPLTDDGHHNMAWSSRLAIETHGSQVYTAHRDRLNLQDMNVLSSVLIQTGTPTYGLGSTITLVSNAFLDDPSSPSSAKARFGFLFQGGQSGRQGLSNANSHHFVINGKVHKLDSMDAIDFPANHQGPITSLGLRMQNDNPDSNQCQIHF